MKSQSFYIIKNDSRAENIKIILSTLLTGILKIFFVIFNPFYDQKTNLIFVKKFNSKFNFGENVFILCVFSHSNGLKNMHLSKENWNIIYNCIKQIPASDLFLG